MHVGLDDEDQDWTDPVWSMVFIILVNKQIQALTLTFG